MSEMEIFYGGFHFLNICSINNTVYMLKFLGWNKVGVSVIACNVCICTWDCLRLCASATMTLCCVQAKAVFDVNNANNKLWVQQAHKHWHVYINININTNAKQNIAVGQVTLSVDSLTHGIFAFWVHIKFVSARKSNWSFLSLSAKLVFCSSWLIQMFCY